MCDKQVKLGLRRKWEKTILRGSSGNQFIQKLYCELMKEEMVFVSNFGSENLTKVLIFHSYFDGYIINSTI